MIINVKRAAAIKSVDDLYEWSGNYGRAINPFSLYLILIRYYNYAVPFADLGNNFPLLGYKEHHLLGEALVAYAAYPDEITDHIDQLFADEGEI